MALTNAYCTVAELRAHLGDTGSKLDTGLLERAINATSRSIDRHCNRRFWQDTSPTTRKYVVDDCWSAWVDDIASTAGVEVKTDPGLAGSFSLTWTADADYQLKPLNGGVDGFTPFAYTQIEATGTKVFPIDWRGTRPTLQITATFGWSDVPDEVNEACLLKAAQLFRRKDAPFGVAGFGEFGPVRITRADPDVMDLLMPYKIKMWG